MFSEIRQRVIEYSIQIERVVSRSLSVLLDIDMADSKSFGNTSSALSFQSKLTLLADIKILEKADKIKLDYFSAIRNQFAHNIDATDFTSCFNAIGDMDSKLRKLYKEKIDVSKTIEVQNEQMFDQLHNDVIDLTSKLFEAIYRKGLEEGKKEGNQIVRETLLETIYDYMERSEPNRVLLSEILDSVKTSYSKKIETAK